MCNTGAFSKAHIVKIFRSAVVQISLLCRRLLSYLHFLQHFMIFFEFPKLTMSVFWTKPTIDHDDLWLRPDELNRLVVLTTMGCNLCSFFRRRHACFGTLSHINERLRHQFALLFFISHILWRKKNVFFLVKYSAKYWNHYPTNAFVRTSFDTVVLLYYSSIT